MATEIRYWKKLERHALSAEYPDLPPRTRELMRERLKQHGIILGRKVILASKNGDGRGKPQVLDGWQLLQACIDEDVKPDFQMLPKKIGAEEFVSIVNDCRRHESPETMHLRAEQRRQRVLKAREEGQSVRVIAEREKVSPATIQEDIKKTGATVHPRTPEGNKKTTGKDGKKYKAKADLLCERCQLIGEPSCDKCRHKASKRADNEAQKAVKQKEKEEQKRLDKAKELEEKAKTLREGRSTNGKPEAAKNREPGDDDEQPSNLKDEAGVKVPGWVIPAFEAGEGLLSIGNELDDLTKRIKDIKDGPAGGLLDYESIKIKIKDLKSIIVQNRPTHVCPDCKAKAEHDRREKDRCRVCNDRGWTCTHVYNRMLSDKK